jgi:hypothetical protein
MGNAVERLFDSVLSKINDFADLDWPDNYVKNPFDTDNIHEPIDSLEDSMNWYFYSLTYIK